MKKYLIILIILSMCGGTAESDLDSLAEISLEAKDVMSEAQKEPFYLLCALAVQ